MARPQEKALDEDPPGAGQRQAGHRSRQARHARAILADYRLVGERLWSRFNGRKGGTLRYYRKMVEALRAAGSGPLMEELDRVVSEIERLAGG